MEQAPGGAGVRQRKPPAEWGRPDADSRTGRVAPAAAINAELFAILSTIITRGRFAFPGPTDAAFAISAYIAFITIRAERAVYAPAIDASFIVVLDSIAVNWKGAHAAVAYSVNAIGRLNAALRIEARATLAAAINAGLERGIDHSILILCANHRNAVE